ncbi:MAG TPA: sugar ABC transporter ATP-binding protein, partial [Acidimicrobiia bacterium]|nr:sugar ABC transporter ATP-binding protein [Acidimicrobiia bacterium]
TKESANPTLQAVGLTKHFRGVTALDSVSIDFRGGEVHAIVGENGAGKSTLIKLINGLYQADEGVITLGGEPIEFNGPHEAREFGISTVFQEINLEPFLSIAQNLFLGREPTRRWGLVDVKRMNREAASLLRRYGVGVDERRALGSVGVAVQQMIAIVRAVSTEAKVVILDEPTSSLEPNEVDQLFQMIRILRDDGVALLYVSHDLDEIFELCDHVTVLRDGKRVHTGPVSDITRLELVATMLGKEVQEVRTSGKTAFNNQGREIGQPVLSATGLSRFRILSDVAIDVKAGEVVGLAGLLGSGRTETVQGIFGLLSLDEGQVFVDSSPIKTGSPGEAVSKGIRLLPEDRKAEGIVPTMSVRDNITLAAGRSVSRWGFLSRSKVDALVERFVDRLQIKLADVDQSIAELSGGNQQKVLIARLLCNDPDVLMLDEPTRGIDVGAKAEIQRLIDELAANGLAVILISSELEDVIEGANRVFVLKEGSVVGELHGSEISEDAIMDLIAHGQLTTERP